MRVCFRESVFVLPAVRSQSQHWVWPSRYRQAAVGLAKGLMDTESQLVQNGEAADKLHEGMFFKGM